MYDSFPCEKQNSTIFDRGRWFSEDLEEVLKYPLSPGF